MLPQIDAGIPTVYTSAENVVQVDAAATDGLEKLRQPAGADSLMLAELRRYPSEQAFIPRPCTMTGGGPSLAKGVREAKGSDSNS